MAGFAIVCTIDGMNAELGTFDSVESAVTWWDHWLTIRPEDGKRGCEVIQKRASKANSVVRSVGPDRG